MLRARRDLAQAPGRPAQDLSAPGAESGGRSCVRLRLLGIAAGRRPLRLDADRRAAHPGPARAGGHHAAHHPCAQALLRGHHRMAAGAPARRALRGIAARRGRDQDHPLQADLPPAHPTGGTRGTRDLRGVDVVRVAIAHDRSVDRPEGEPVAEPGGDHAPLAAGRSIATAHAALRVDPRPQRLSQEGLPLAHRGVRHRRTPAP